MLTGGDVVIYTNKHGGDCVSGRVGTRITMTIPNAKYATLKLVASAMEMTPGEMAKEMVFAGLDMLSDVVEISSEDGITEERALRKMFSISLEKLAKGIEG